MKQNKILIILTATIITLITVACSFHDGQTDELKNVVIIGWDGTQRNHLKTMIKEKKLPNLIKLMQEGSFVDIEITTGHTETKPGWAEVLTGYSAIRLGVFTNNEYKPIPRTYTIFERFKKHFGRQNIKAIFIGGKINNIGFRGPHEICDNCITRFRDTHLKTYSWDRELIKTDETKDGKPPHWVKRDGEPYYFTKDSLDYHKTVLEQANNVGEEVLKALDLHGKERFIAFFHFEEPDENGHQFGENSDEYDQGLKTVDRWLGTIVKKLKKLGVYDKTLLVVTSDHGMDEGRHGHKKAPYTFLVTNSKHKLLPAGDRKDVSVTIYDAFGISYDQFDPPLDGKSLLVR